MIGLELKTYNVNAAGVGRYSIQLVDHLLKRKKFPYFGFTSPQTDILKVPLAANQRFVNTQSTILRSISIPQLHWNSKIKLMHILDGSNYYGLFSKGVKQIITVHDLIALKFPQYFTRKMSLILTHRFKHAINRADYVIAVSHTTKSDLLTFFPKLNSEKIKVIHEASCLLYDQSPNLIIPKNLEKLLESNCRFFLSVATREPRKNLKLIIESFQVLRQREDQNLWLVLVGQKGWLQSAALYESPDMLKNVIITGQVSDQELKSWYKHAISLVYPSFYEGFGLPVLEAMSLGCPVITSNVSSLPEISGDAAIQVDPYSLLDLISAMRRVVEDKDLRSRMIKKGVLQSKTFSWEKTAAATELVYAQLL